MRELLDYLRANGFKTYIVSGGEVEFMRAWTDEVYGIPPEQVIGTTFTGRYDYNDGKPVIMRMPQLAHNDDGPGKPVSIDAVIGRRPIFAFVTPTVISKCCSGLRRARASDSWGWCITPMRSVNGLMTESRKSGGWTRRSIKPRHKTGPLWIWPRSGAKYTPLIRRFNNRQRGGTTYETAA